ncbi:MAG: hypothetical protein LLG13_11000 [Bacteroidales bacterium]|nr:hypothetical protein [Bacteroidales bacterium]
MAIADIFLRLRANSAELTKGLEQSKSAMRKTGDVSKELGKQMNGVFQEASKAIDNVIPGFSRFTSGIGKALSSVTSFSKGLNVLKIALIGTGIGAIVVALGTLVSYFTSADRGADKFSEKLAGVKAIITTLITRINLFAEGIIAFVNLDFKGGIEKMKQAFSNLGESISKSYTEGEKLKKSFHDLEDVEAEFIVTESELSNKLKLAREIMSDPDASIEQKQKAITDATKAETELYQKQSAILYEKYRIEVNTNNLGEESEETLARENTILAQINNLEGDRALAMSRLNKMQKTLNNAKEEELKKQLEIQKASNVSSISNIAKMASSNVKNLTMPTFAPETDTTTLAKSNISFIPNDLPAWKSYWDAIKAMAEESSQQRLQIATDAATNTLSLLDSIASFQEAAMNNEISAAGDNEAKKDEIRRKYAKKAKSIAIMQAIINGAIAITKGFADLGPIGGFISAGLIAIATAAQVSVIKSQAFANGGLAYGPTLGLVGEYANARSNPEVIAPLNKLQSILGNSFMNGEVKFRIEGNTLVGILNKQTKLMNA